VRGVVSYASQEPWLFAGSVQQNILFGLPMNKERYRKVINKQNVLILIINLYPYFCKPGYKSMCIENRF